ncbi:Cof-type HAD-IIB family hydrolase [Lacticaseibacillus saniviri]|uniref:Cof-type HAD-IIB family hydrolase n=1 Tax=Lacticaseibacillus saniviri TaxID=931533 RepID=UPI001EDF2502|nr:Cof-type HAD-IIB family hydrolase [Lacticaseibacillus saniviri]MCG4281476.1 Cof-type HAD-IIB family hydrolase [Lacticaseibacillus saniviri]
MYKAATFFDLDGTLFDNDKQVPPENRQALAELKANNVLPVIATGRNHWEIAPMLEANHIDTLVGANGAYVWYKGEAIVKNVIDTDVLNRVTQVAKEDGLPIAFYNENTVAITMKNQMTQNNYKLVHQDQPREDPDFYQKGPVFMFLLFTPQKPIEADMQAKYEKLFPELTFYRNSPYAIDVVNHGVTKATGIQALLKQPELAEATTYAFGDGNNDIPMLEFADYGVAMGNALPQVAAVAQFQTTSNLDGGIVNGLKHYHLI